MNHYEKPILEIQTIELEETLLCASTLGIGDGDADPDWGQL